MRPTSGTSRAHSVNQWLLDPPVTDTDDLVAMLDEVSGTITSLVESLGEFSQWLNHAGVHPEVVQRVERAAESGGDMCPDLADTASHAERAYSTVPDFGA